MNFSKLDTEIARVAYILRKDARDWKVKLAQDDLKKSGLSEDKLKKISYRPFDNRWTYFTGNSRGFIGQPCIGVMSHMLHDNIGIITARSNKSQKMDHFFITNNLMETKCGESTTQSAIFPLYLYPSTDKKDLFSEHETSEKKPSIKPEIFEQLTRNFKKEVTPEEIFYYIYAIFYSNTYRNKYFELLKIDFPRVPFTSDYKLFIMLGNLGKQLADLHLLKSQDLDKSLGKYPISGNNTVEKIKYEIGKVWINEEQYFINVKEEVWQYQIGGYQVCEKWLKDRKGRTLTHEEIQTYSKIVNALSKTIDLQSEIDKYYDSVEKTVKVL